VSKKQVVFVCISAAKTTERESAEETSQRVGVRRLADMELSKEVMLCLSWQASA
jgi:hypothetical protein